MTITDGLGFNSLEPSMNHMMCSTSSTYKYKTKRNKKNLKVRSDMEGNLKMWHLKLFVKNMELSTSSLLLELHKNGVVEIKNISLQEMAKTMIHENNLSKYMWEEVVNTTCYLHNRIYIIHILNKTSYELFKGRNTIISYFHQFGCTCYFLNNKVYLKKFDAKAQKGVLLGFSECSKAYRIYNCETKMVEESIHIKFDDKESDSKMSELIQSFLEICVSKDT